MPDGEPRVILATGRYIGEGSLKLDENLGERGADLFRLGGHDVATVSGQLKIVSIRDLSQPGKIPATWVGASNYY